MDPPILILSNPRTGSTLLRWLLDTHPAICSPNELSLGACCYHLSVVIDATLGPEYREVPADMRRVRCLADVRRVVDGLLETYCAARKKSRWCEKTPSNLKFLDLLQAVFPDAAYLCLHRHCLDTVRSAIETYGESPIELQPYREKHHGHVVASFIERWCDLTERLIAFEAAHPARTRRVIYEELVRDPDGVLQPLMAFIGVPWVPGLAARAFEVPHDLGRGDPKIADTTMIELDRVGKGRQLDVRGVSAHLIDRMERLHDLLGYERGRLPSCAALASRSARHLQTRASDTCHAVAPRNGSNPSLRLMRSIATFESAVPITMSSIPRRSRTMRSSIAAFSHVPRPCPRWVGCTTVPH